MFSSDINLDNSFEFSPSDNKVDSSLTLPWLLFKKNILEDTDNLNSAFNENDKGINLEGAYSQPEKSFINQLHLYKNLEEKSTFVTNIGNQILMNQNKNNIPKEYTFDDIKQILKGKDFEKYKEIIDNPKHEPKLKETKKNIKVINKKRKKVLI